MSTVQVYNHINRGKYAAALVEASNIESVRDDDPYPQWAMNQLQNRRDEGLADSAEATATELEAALQGLGARPAKRDVQTNHQPVTEPARHSRRSRPASDFGSTLSLNGTDFTPVMGPPTDGADACSRFWGSMPRDSIPSGSTTISTGPNLDI